MLRARIIPTLLLRNESLVKTRRFAKPVYVGDPCNTVRIFNELEVDELIFLDITATREGRQPNLKLLADIAAECFMPLAYGGGVRSFLEAQEILKTGFEKISINTAALENPQLVTDLAVHFGNQAVIVSIDVGRDIFGRQRVFSHSGHRNTHRDPVAWAREAARRGAGEILLTVIEREGTWQGFEIDLIRSVVNAVDVPVIVQGGAGSPMDVEAAIRQGGASAAAVGSLVVFQKKGKGVLINFSDELRALELS